MKRDQNEIQKNFTCCVTLLLYLITFKGLILPKPTSVTGISHMFIVTKKENGTVLTLTISIIYKVKDDTYIALKATKETTYFLKSRQNIP